MDYPQQMENKMNPWKGYGDATRCLSEAWPHWGKIHWSIDWHIVRPVSSARAPKTGERLSEARAFALLPHWGMNIDMYGQEWSMPFIENYFNFRILDQSQ